MTPTPEPTSTYINSPEGACEEAAARLHVVVTLLHSTYDSPPEAGGYDLLIAIEEIHRIGDMLREVTEHATAQDTVPNAEGGTS